MVLVRYANRITSSAGRNDDEFLKIAEIEDAVRDLRFGLFMIAINPDFVCSALQLPSMSYFLGKPKGRLPATTTEQGLKTTATFLGKRNIS